MGPCIYILYWDINIPYIGQTVCLNKRVQAHYSSLIRKDHCNYKILKEYNNSKELPIVQPLIYCRTEELNSLEEQFIVEFNSINCGLNIISGGFSVGKGTHNSSSKYSEQQLIEVFKLLTDINNCYKIISEKTLVPLSTVKKIGQGVQHIWLQEEFPDLYSQILQIKNKRYSVSASAKSQNKNYRKIVSPEGVVYEVTNTLQFSKEHNLRNGNLCQVLSGKRNSVAGWMGVPP